MTSQARAFRALFTEWGWGGHDVAWHIDPRIASEIKPLNTLEDQLGPDDVLLIHYSAYAPRLRGVLELEQRKVLLSHNVTPARWFWDYEPTIAIHCQLGRQQLPEYAKKADVVAGVSAYNAAELGSDRVVPILFDPQRLGPANDADPPAGTPPTLLFIGRLAPHKRQDELIRVLAMLRRNRIPDARLRLIGEPTNANYLEALEGLAEKLAPGAVTFEQSLSTEELADAYRESHVFVCLSEHEGFCIPLLEAFHLGLPVVSRPSGGIPEVAGDAALLTKDRDLAVVAELVALAVEDGELRGEMRRRGRARLVEFSHDVTAQKLRKLLEDAAGS